MLLDRPIKVEGDDFERFIAESEAPVLVDFYADWCGPCRMMAPLLDEIASDLTGELIVAKLDTDASPQVSGALGIRGIPTLILFRDGSEAGRLTGAVPRPEIEELIAARETAASGRNDE
ncbi:MAG: thioredoxin [Gemmatimonadota bacterium]|nr:thioredoxin [Gemmatimonadota bacterium]